MSNLTNQQKAIYAILADNAYWDVSKYRLDIFPNDLVSYI